jgi:hypothetical protein
MENFNTGDFVIVNDEGCYITKSFQPQFNILNYICCDSTYIYCKTLYIEDIVPTYIPFLAGRKVIFFEGDAGKTGEVVSYDDTTKNYVISCDGNNNNINKNNVFNVCFDKDDKVYELFLKNNQKTTLKKKKTITCTGIDISKDIKYSLIDKKYLGWPDLTILISDKLIYDLNNSLTDCRNSFATAVPPKEIPKSLIELYKLPTLDIPLSNEFPQEKKCMIDVIKNFKKFFKDEEIYKEFVSNKISLHEPIETSNPLYPLFIEILYDIEKDLKPKITV